MKSINVERWMQRSRRAAGAALVSGFVDVLHRVSRETRWPARQTLARRRLADHTQFVRSWVANPRGVGAMAPSSRWLAKAMVRPVDPDAGVILELGPGTGAITRALLRHRVAPERLILVERDRALAALLRRRFPGLEVLDGPAQDVPRLMERTGGLVAGLHGAGGAGGAGGEGERVAAILSSLPFLSMPNQEVRAILAAVLPLFDERTDWIQYTYGASPPIPTTLCREFGLKGERIEWVVRNLPPAAIWRFRKAPGGGPGGAALGKQVRVGRGAPGS